MSNVYDPAAIQHEFVRKALRFFTEDLPEGEYDGSEDDLREYASTITEGLGYDLDQRIAAQLAENEQLRGKLFKAAKSLKRIIKGWRDYAAGDYCQTYNPERGKGLRMAADDLENYVYDAYRGEE